MTIHHVILGLALSLAILSTVACSRAERTSSTPPSATPTAVPAAPSLIADSPAFKRGAEIGRRVIQDESYLTGDVYNEFWAEIRASNISDAQLGELREAVSGIAVVYQKHFFQDASQALRSGQPFKSGEREQYEKGFLERAPRIRVDPAVIREQFRQNDELIGKIATKTPVQSGGRSVLWTEEIIAGALARLDNIQKRLDRLFTPPPAGRSGLSGDGKDLGQKRVSREPPRLGDESTDA